VGLFRLLTRWEGSPEGRGWDKILEICSCNWAENMVHYGAWAYIFFIVTGLKIWQKT
jgi:hypothetical protein